MAYEVFDRLTSEYENWFNDNEILFQSEILALQQVVPADKKGVEIGIGGGIFAEKLGIKFGIDPSENMLNYARARNLTVKKGFAENLPYTDQSFDFAAFITSMCFIDNPEKALTEAHRIIKSDGNIIIAMLDKESTLGKTLESEKENNPYFKYAGLFSVPEMTSLLAGHHFETTEIWQTLFDMQSKIPENPIKGFGKGSFVVIKAKRK